MGRKKSNDLEIEEKKESLKNEEVVRKNNSKTPIVICVVIICIIMCISSTIWAFKLGKFDFVLDFLESNKEKISLNHTDSVTVKSDGIYITDVSDVVDEVMPSIVAITSKTVIDSGMFGYSFFGNNQYTAEGAGSGVIVAENDSEVFILTNYHVVENSSELSVKFVDDKSYDASVKGTSERKDVAIVSVSKKSLDEDTLKAIKIATLGSSDELKVGNGIIAIGNALGYGQSVITGVVSALNRELTTDNYVQNMIQIDAAINGGNSGGALLNSKGEVVGINTAKYSSAATSSSASIEGMGFAIPISSVESVIETLINGKNDSSGVLLGIEGYMTNSSNYASYDVPTGFYIAKIYDDSNAEKAGLEIGNIITEIDNTKITSFSDLKKELNKKEAGDKVTLKISYASRNQYKEKEIIVTLN